MIHKRDVVLIGAGIMSSTLGTLINQLEPTWDIALLESESGPAHESSNAWNNAGTGHSALCELNYTKQGPDGEVDIAQALKVNEQFQVTRQLWSHLISTGVLGSSSSFINPIPHMSFVSGEANVDQLTRRRRALSQSPLFAGLDLTTDPDEFATWAPLMMAGRDAGEPLAATRANSGSDVDFGSLTRQLLEHLDSRGTDIRYGHKVTDLSQAPDGAWRVTAVDQASGTKVRYLARFVFVGAGGGALPLLQKAGIPEVHDLGGFPVSGQFLRCLNPDVVAQHTAKVYGQPPFGAPPMSAPHLDTRVIDGERALLFGPYAGFTPKFLKAGSLWDLPGSIRPGNVVPMLAAGLDNASLTTYLVRQIAQSHHARMDQLRTFVPTADDDEWELITAGQRVQVIKRTPTQRGMLQFGTEVVASADGRLAGLLGASPGASTAVPVMLDVLARCFPDRIEGWTPALRDAIPSYGRKLNDDPDLAASIMESTAKVLGLEFGPTPPKSPAARG